jgi:hypothetical protein
MKKQWRQFVEENQCYWSYGIVPHLVERLDAALKAGDEKGVRNALDGLSSQGVVLDKNGDLRFVSGVMYYGVH